MSPWKFKPSFIYARVTVVKYVEISKGRRLSPCSRLIFHIFLEYSSNPGKFVRKEGGVVADFPGNLEHRSDTVREMNTESPDHVFVF